ncbi:hypothetical protein BIW11_07927 [Tropilaelaps mercedesae]|uniref:Uncharacterized protein n=1 Tax=Tropilaelaps mercedesae TaxID=418985 RepID=A0A1V9XS47_9ACAR|nr:hypothetical protein BIW11_07927 [Tropilaelaps mercedesae]
MHLFCRTKEGNGLEREDDLSVIEQVNEIDQSISRVKSRQNLDEGPSGPGTSAANDFVDDVLKNLPKFDVHINPARLGDLHRGALQLTNVTLSGIRDAYRYISGKITA